MKKVYDRLICVRPALLALVFYLSQFAVVAATAQTANTPSDTNKELEDILGGFDDGDVTQQAPKEAEEPQTKPSRWNLTGSTTLGSSYNYAHKAPKAGKTDYRGLSRLRIKGVLELNAKLKNNWRGKVNVSGFHDFAYQINGRDQYTSRFLDKYENETKLNEAYVLGSVSDNIDIKIGRQVVVWGGSDNIRITDILNPLDNRQPGLVDIEDLREPIAMTKLDYYFGKWDVSTIAIPEIRFDKNPVYGSDFFPAPSPLPKDNIPSSNLANAEYALALNGIFSGYDVAFYFADVFDSTPHFEINNATGAPSRSHSRIKMLGASSNIAIGNWLIKGEAARFEGKEYSLVTGRRYTRLDSLIGVEYSGITDNVFSMDISNRHIRNFDSPLYTSGVKQDEYQTAIRYQGNFINSTMHALALVSFFGLDGKDGSFGRLSLKYDVIDSLSTTGGVVFYQSVTAQSGAYLFFSNIGDNDRLFLDIKYSF